MISAVLSCVVDDSPYQIVIDTIDSDSVSGSVTITEQPLMNGEFISDHLFKKPISYSISGMFGMGNRQGIVVNDGKIQLTEVQELFEKIRDNGIICSVVRVRIDDKNNREVRFLKRENLCLESIQWTQNIDTLGFSFQFKEIAFVAPIQYSVDLDDAFNPNVQDLVQRSFSESLLSRQDALKSILSFMYENDIMSDTFWKALIGNRAETFLALGIGVAVAYALGSLIVACGASGPVGWIVGVIVVALALIAVGIAKIVRRCKFKIKPFDKYNEKELKRWAELMEKMSDEIASVSDHIQVFQPSSDDDQECVLTIDGNIYVFAFTTNNVNGERSLVVTNGAEEQIGSLSNIGCAPTNYGDCNKANAIYSNDNQKLYIHLIYTGEDTQEEKAKLKNYLLTISNIEAEKFEEMMAQIIKNYLLK